ncbi:MAG: SH3 domain-containing protein [Chloroflexota bacterium]
MRQAEQVALEYQNHQNLDAARSGLNDINVANGTQWFVMVTESALAENSNPILMSALVKLALDLGLQSQPVQQYALETGLLPTPVIPGQAVAADAVSEQSPQGNRVIAPATAPPAAQQEGNNSEAAVEIAAQPTVVEAKPTDTPATQPLARALNAINIRNGPGINYVVVGSAQAGEELTVMGKSPAGDWWQVLLSTGQPGWIFGQLVDALNVEEVGIAQNIPAPPPTPVPVAPTNTPVPPEPEAPAAPEPPPVDTSNPHFTLVHRQLVSKQDNGDCQGRHLLRIFVKDAAGNLLNGVTLKGVYVGDEIKTGDQGKGDGIIEYDLHGSGEAFRIIRDVNGNNASSDEAGGFTTRSVDIDKPTLIAAGYCSDDADCDVFYNSYGCHGHHSWIAEFARNY